jgi:hypothetical protein
LYGEVPVSADIQRWSKRRKSEVVMRLLRGESLDDVSREVGVEISRLEKWRDKAMRGLEEGLRERDGDPILVGLDDANRWIGELSMENNLVASAILVTISSEASRRGSASKWQYR